MGRGSTHDARARGKRSREPSQRAVRFPRLSALPHPLWRIFREDARGRMEPKRTYLAAYVALAMTSEHSCGGSPRDFSCVASLHPSG